MNRMVKLSRRMAWGLVIIILLFASCDKRKKTLAHAITMRDSMPVMTTYDVNTLISDSGIIRFRMKAPIWMIYDRRHPSFWSFEKGIYVEQFDSLLHINASIKADTAYFYDQERLWRLIGHVAIKNRKGEKFNTKELFWNQFTQKVYSDKFIRIELLDKIITGYGFESNQEFTVWKIHNTAGIFYVSTHPADTTKAEPVK
jgi:LPS export ABC transporter protein LptC